MMKSAIERMQDMSDRNVLITGACGHLGTVFAETLYDLGANIILVDKPGSKFESVFEKISVKNLGKINIYECDLEVEENREELISKIGKEINNLHCLINNAAFVGDSKLDGWVVDFEKQSLNTWRRAMEVNLTSGFHLSQGLYPFLKLNKGANIINIGSIYGAYGPDFSLYENTDMGNPAAYGVSKAGVHQLTRWMATRLAPEVRVNCIAPGGISRGQPVRFVEKYKNRTPLARMGTEDDFRGSITYLATDMSSYVTGQTLNVDGGWGTW